MIQRRHRLAAPALGLARWQRLVREANITPSGGLYGTRRPSLKGCTAGV